MRSATKSRSIHSLECAPTSIAFDTLGKHLAVFSLEDSSIRIFQSGAIGIIGSIFGWKNTQIKAINVPRKSIDYETLKKNYKIKLSWTENDRQVVINFGENTQMNFDVF